VEIICRTVIVLIHKFQSNILKLDKVDLFHGCKLTPCIPFASFSTTLLPSKLTKQKELLVVPTKVFDEQLRRHLELRTVTFVGFGRGQSNRNKGAPLNLPRLPPKATVPCRLLGKKFFMLQDQPPCPAQNVATKKYLILVTRSL
jgi:hypothetical protein